MDPPASRSPSPIQYSINDQSGGFPALRYNDGDVIVKISQRPSECLLLHSSVLKAAMPQLAPAFAARWGQGDAVEHPVTGAQFTVYTLALKGVEETVLLEGKELVDLRDKDRVTGCENRFLNSIELARPGWPEREVVFTTLERFLRQIGSLYRIMFAMMYQKPVDAAMFCGELKLRGSDAGAAIEDVATLCAMAEYHEALPAIAQRVVELVLSFDLLWESVRCRPATFLRVAAKLKIKELYLDALRHLVARGNISELAEALEMSVTDAETTFRPAIKQLSEKVTDICNFLLCQGLTTQRRQFGHGTTNVKNSLFNSLNFRSRTRSKETKARERFNYFAKKIFNEWVTKHIAGASRLYENSSGKTRAEELRDGVHTVIARLRKAAKTDRPFDVVGRNAPEYHVSVFDLGPRKYDPVGRIRATITELVKTSAAFLEKEFRDTQQWDHRDRDSNGKAMLKVYRSTRCDGKANDMPSGFTYLGIDERTMLWDNEPVIVPEKIPIVDLSPANDVVLKAFDLVDPTVDDQGSEAGATDSGEALGDGSDQDGDEQSTDDSDDESSGDDGSSGDDETSDDEEDEASGDDEDE